MCTTLKIQLSLGNCLLISTLVLILSHCLAPPSPSIMVTIHLVIRIVYS